MRQCIFCSQNRKGVDYRDVETLNRFVSSQAKIINPKHTGVCSKHQRLLAKAIKRARMVGLLPFTKQH